MGKAEVLSPSELWSSPKQVLSLSHSQVRHCMMGIIRHNLSLICRNRKLDNIYANNLPRKRDGSYTKQFEKLFIRNFVSLSNFVVIIYLFLEWLCKTQKLQGNNTEGLGPGLILADLCNG